MIERDLRELSNVSSHHFPDRSAKWLIRQREHLEGLLRMVAGQIADALDFAHVEQLNRSFISDELRTQESDMIFKVPFRSPTQTRQEVIVYLLIEHQSTVDPSMGLRLLSYMVQIWMEERRQWQEAKRPQSEWRLTPIVPIVFYTGKGEWTTPLSLTALLDIPEILTRFVPTFDTLLLDVKATAPDELTQNRYPLGWLLSVLQHEDSDADAMRKVLLDALEGLRDLHAADADQYRRAILYIFLLILHRSDADEHQDLLRILTKEHTQNQEIVNMA
ncbi:MAG: Rpn family recombination-promoting nuclease/putative transposase, partial [Candidatus Poribacteria bacterium]|nr:Rpn family recombination-promoting nuclease/putative transposase [Candidatus Poribacteria bacterium]